MFCDFVVAGFGWRHALTYLPGWKLLSAFLLLLLIYIVGCILYNLHIHPLSRYPGPKLAAITPLVHLLWDIQGKQHSTMKALHDKYGDVVRIAPNALVYRAATAWKDIYGHRKKGHKIFLKDPALYAPTPNGVNAIITANEEDHSRMRRLLTHAFSNQALRAQEEILQKYADMFISKLQETLGSSASKDLDITRWFNFTTFDLIGDLAFGEPFGCLDNSTYHWWVLIILDAVKASAYLKVFWFYPFLAPMVKFLVPKHLLEKRQASFDLSVEKVRRRLAHGTTRPDFTSYILKHSADGKGVSPEEMDANAAVFVLAGSETTAALLSGCTYYLLRNRDKYERLLREIRGAFNSLPMIKLTSLVELPYLNAVLTETMRVYPPIPSMLPRIVPEGGAIINDKFVPENVSVSISLFSTFNAACHFKKPESFIPERWLADSKGFENDNKDAFQPYSYGPRNCLGQHLANAEMRLLLAKFLWTFDMELLPDSINWTQQKSFALWKRPDLNIKLYRAGDAIAL
ncbi:hypothetical protein PENANT_c059G08193 [Penicillium antarcticum]|uniref:Uncharacterized protein n=1 Tax=Penicillium antarcticum TaxID=416450 RepID=A0A1V6PQ94_9EURO|nr:uncharacterized protein N7508_001713 [Penicillium antarcticum]KAJ5317205.1 hypothetical protein N7508_001713 [Penicillium antarcticum]OQD79179.1 hypothetical protein PENANT_c059G08193 [Penicillium antarcticum]